MYKFKTLDIEDKEIFHKYQKYYSFKTYEYSFINLYLWRRYCDVRYTIIKDALIIKKTEEKIGSYFLEPIGYSDENLKEIISELLKMKETDKNINFIFRDVEEPFVQKLKNIYGENFLYDEDVKNFDYIYETEKMINLPGEKLRKRKLQYNQFADNYNYSIKDIQDENVIADCIEFSRIWFEAQKSTNRELKFEVGGVKDVLINSSHLNVIGMAVYVDEKIVGFTIGEKVNDQLAIVHTEKGDTAYKGVYAFINRCFAEQYLKGITYVNREEDLGIAGLRKAKLAYDPYKLEKRYIITFLRGVI